MSEFYEWQEAPKARLAVIGDPIDHSLSPVMQTAALKSLYLDETYVGIRIPEAEFDEALAHLDSLGYFGLNVTTPLKERAYAWCSIRQDPAERVGAVNTLRIGDRSGTNTDLEGFRLAYCSDIGSSDTALVLGAGGSAATVLVSLKDQGCRVRAWNRTRPRLEELIDRLALDIELVDDPDPSGCSLIVNCTSAGLNGTAPPVLWQSADRSARGIDLFYGSGLTPFQIAASKRGIRAQDGKRMLVEQGALSLEWWTGLSVMREIMAAAIA